MALPSYLASTGQIWLSTAICDEGCGERFERFSRSTGWRQVLCSWLDRIGLINNVGSQVNLEISGAFVYNFAIGYPDAPNVLFYDSLETVGIPINGLNVGPNGMVGYALARIKFQFKVNPYIELDQGTLSIDFAIQDAELPTNTTSYSFNGDKTNYVDASQLPAIQTTLVTYTWTRYNLASIPTSTISAACAAPIDQSGLFGTSTANGGTLRLMGVKTNRRVGQTGVEVWDMTVILCEQPAGWNCVFWPSAHSSGGTDAFVPVKDDSGNYPIALDMGGNIPALVQDVGY